MAAPIEVAEIPWKQSCDKIKGDMNGRRHLSSEFASDAELLAAVFQEHLDAGISMPSWEVVRTKAAVFWKQLRVQLSSPRDDLTRSLVLGYPGLSLSTRSMAQTPCQHESAAETAAETQELPSPRFEVHFQPLSTEQTADLQEISSSASALMMDEASNAATREIRFSSLVAVLQESTTLLALEPNLTHPSLAEKASEQTLDKVSGEVGDSEFDMLDCSENASRQAPCAGKDEFARASKVVAAVAPSALQSLKRAISLAQKAQNLVKTSASNNADVECLYVPT